jgi:DNA polymerase III subunit epsilon
MESMVVSSSSMRDEAARIAAVEWARGILAREDVVVLDTETTGLGSDDEAIEVAVCSIDRQPIIDTLVYSNRKIHPRAQAVHGIYAADLVNAPRFSEIYDRLREIYTDRIIVGWNIGFDLIKVTHTCKVAGLPDLATISRFHDGCPQFQDAMLHHANWYGEYQNGKYRKQKLNGGHRAMGDCLAVIDCIEQMAADSI